MNLNSLGTGLTKNADKIGALASLFVGAPGFNTIDAVVSSLQQISAGVIHAPDMLQLQNWLQYEGKDAILAYLAGILIDDLNVPFIGKYGKVIQKGAFGYGAGTLGIRVLYGMTHSPLKGQNIENSPSVRENFNAAPIAPTYY